MLRFVLILLVALVIAVPLAWAVFTGLRTGRLPHTDSTSVLVRAEAPVRYWLLMALFAAMLAGLSAVVFLSARQVFG